MYVLDSRNSSLLVSIFSFRQLGNDKKVLEKDFEELQASLSAASSQKIDKDTLDLELLKVKKYYQNLISQEMADLNRRLDAIQKEIDGLQKISRLYQQAQPSASKPKAPAKSAATQAAGPGKKTTPPKSGTIVEQDIPE